MTLNETLNRIDLRLSLHHLINQLLSPLPEGHKTRIDGEFNIGDRKYSFKAYCLQSRAKGNPVDMIRIDVKGE